MQIQDSDAGFGITNAECVPVPEISALLITRRMSQLMEHGFQACGNVPLEEDNGSDGMGVLKLDYVKYAHPFLETTFANRRFIVYNH